MSNQRERMVGVNSHEKYMECSLGVFNGNLFESRIKRMSLPLKEQ